MSKLGASHQMTSSGTWTSCAGVSSSRSLQSSSRSPRLHVRTADLRLPNAPPAARPCRRGRAHSDGGSRDLSPLPENVLFRGIFLALPVILSQVWLFVAPGLYRKEKRYAVPFIFMGTGFFLGGASFGHLVVFPYATHFLTTFGGESIGILLTVSQVFAFYSKFILGMGLVFEIPTFVFVLARMGLVTPGFLWAKFKYAVLLIFVAAAIITPTPDVVTQSLLAIPMIGLYILSIGIACFVDAKGKA